MIFANKKFFGISESDFIDSPKVAYATLGSVRTIKGNTPVDSTAIDKKLQVALIKCYSEYLERSRMGFNVGLDKKCMVVDMITNVLKPSNHKYYGYNHSVLYGKVDTTGTAAGVNGEMIIKNSFLELIEKNEMFLFWYMKKGNYVIKNSFVRKKISKLGFSSSQIEIFYSDELCTYPTYYVILIDNKKVIATGCGISNSHDKALSKALEEARLLEWQNKNNPNSIYTRMTVEERKQSIVYIELLKKVLPKTSNIERTVLDLKIASWIESVEVMLIAKNNLVVKCISKDIFNCLPTIENLKKSKNKKIWKIYGCDYSQIENCTPCILL